MGEEFKHSLDFICTDHRTAQVLAYVLANHKDRAFVELKALLEPFGIMQFYSDGWGAYEGHIAPVFHTVGKRNTQKIEWSATLPRAAQAFNPTHSD